MLEQKTASSFLTAVASGIRCSPKERLGLSLRASGHVQGREGKVLEVGEGGLQQS